MWSVLVDPDSPSLQRPEEQMPRKKRCAPTPTEHRTTNDTNAPKEADEPAQENALNEDSVPAEAPPGKPAKSATEKVGSSTSSRKSPNRET